MNRRLLSALAALVVLAAGLFLGVRALKRAAVNEVLTALERMDCRPQSESWAWVTLSLHNVRCPGVQVGKLVLDAPSRSAAFETVIVDVGALPWPRLRDMARHRENADAIAEAGQGGFSLTATDVSFTYGGTAFADGLAGSLWPLSLKGEGAVFAGSPSEGFAFEFSAPLPHPAFSGSWNAAGSVEHGLNTEWSVKLTVTGGGLSHETLGKSTLTDVALTLRGGVDLDPVARFEGELIANRLQVKLELERLSEGPLVHVALDAVSLDDALSPFESWLPELEGATLTGTLTADLKKSPAGDWKLVADLQNPWVDGVLATGFHRQLGEGRLILRVPDGEGGWRLRTTGRNHPDWIALPVVSQAMQDAVIAAEDAGFRRHGGYDLQAISEAFEESMKAGEVVRGGSTLTQQLAKNLFLDGRQTLRRKLREILLAIELDRVLGKDGVLELYLNVVEWGPEIFGVGQASERYFMKRPIALNPRESAFLAVLLPSPRTYYKDWYLTGRGAALRVDWVLDNMVAAKALTRDQAAFWKDEFIEFVPPPVSPAAPEE